MPTIAPASVIDAPARVPDGYGLFSRITPVTTVTERWQSGVEWTDQSCTLLPGLVIPDCDPAQVQGLPKEFPDGLANGQALPFVVYGSFKCGPIGLSPASTRAQDLASDRLATREEATVTHALWVLLTTDGGPLRGTAQADGSPAATLAAMETTLAGEYGSQGLLIASLSALYALASAQLLRRDDVLPGLETIAGTPIVIDRLNTAPQIGLVPRPVIYRGDVFTSASSPFDLLDTGHNDLYAVAERDYAAGWTDCGATYATVT